MFHAGTGINWTNKEPTANVAYISNVAFYGGVTTKFTYNVKIPDSKTTMISQQKIGLKIVEMQ